MGSGNQAWHKDNRARGLSIILPLVDFHAENGGTQLLLGSHHDHENEGALAGTHAGAGAGARVVAAPAGSIVAYDSRTIHRGLGNETMEGRPALIFCYDRVVSPPPGCGTLGSVATSYRGRFLDILSGARSLSASSLTSVFTSVFTSVSSSVSSSVFTPGEAEGKKDKNKIRNDLGD